MEEEENVNLPVSLFFSHASTFFAGGINPLPPSFLSRSYPSNHPSPLPSSCSLFAATLVGRWEEERGGDLCFRSCCVLRKKKLARFQ